jgi:hypothetical protein
VLDTTTRKNTAQYVLDTTTRKNTAQYVLDTTTRKNTAQYVLDTTTRKNTAQKGYNGEREIKLSFRTFFVLVLEKLPGDHKETSFHPTTSMSLPVDSITPMTYIKVCCNKFAYWRVVAYSLF